MTPEEKRARTRETKRKYYASEKGKACKQREEAAYKASGGRRATEKRRDAALTPARKAARKRWAERNRWYSAADRAYRRALARMPMSLADKVEISGLYLFAQCFPWFEVDRIVPLKHEKVCGLHILPNLQVIPRKLNRSKGNQFCPAVPKMWMELR